MQSVEIIRDFRNGDLTPTSELEDLKYIGPYLYRGLRREFRISGPVFTIRRFASSIRNLRLDVLKERIGKALRNERRHQCVHRPNRDPHFVAEINEKGHETLLSLIRVLGRGADGYNMGAGFRFDASRLRKPRRRDPETMYLPCLRSNSVQCTRRGGNYSRGHCMPGSRKVGYPGIRPSSAQKRRVVRSRSRSRKYSRDAQRRYEWRIPR